MFNKEARCDLEVKSRLSHATERLGKLRALWKRRSISNRLKAKLIKSLIWPIITYGSEAWTLNKELRVNIEAFEMRCYRKAMRIKYTEHQTNESVLRQVGQTRGLLPKIKSRKLTYFGHTSHTSATDYSVIISFHMDTQTTHR